MAGVSPSLCVAVRAVLDRLCRQAPHPGPTRRRQRPPPPSLTARPFLSHAPGVPACPSPAGGEGRLREGPGAADWGRGGKQNKTTFVGSQGGNVRAPRPLPCRCRGSGWDCARRASTRRREPRLRWVLNHSLNGNDSPGAQPCPSAVPRSPQTLPLVSQPRPSACFPSVLSPLSPVVPLAPSPPLSPLPSYIVLPVSLQGPSDPLPFPSFLAQPSVPFSLAAAPPTLVSSAPPLRPASAAGSALPPPAGLSQPLARSALWRLRMLTAPDCKVLQRDLLGCVPVAPARVRPPAASRWCCR